MCFSTSVVRPHIAVSRGWCYLKKKKSLLKRAAAQFHIIVRVSVEHSVYSWKMFGAHLSELLPWSRKMKLWEQFFLVQNFMFITVISNYFIQNFTISAIIYKYILVIFYFFMHIRKVSFLQEQPEYYPLVFSRILTHRRVSPWLNPNTKWDISYYLFTV